MSTNELILTLVGWVATEPRRYVGASTNAYTSFRMACTRRHFDRAAGTWVDGRTEWFTVKTWRQQAENVAASLRKSDPVIVHGKLVTEQWTAADGPRTTLVLEAIAIGPNLTFGEAKFGRTVHVAAGAQAGEPEAAVDLDDPDEPDDPDDPDEPDEPDEPDDLALLADDLTDDLAGVP